MTARRALLVLIAELERYYKSESESCWQVATLLHKAHGLFVPCGARNPKKKLRCHLGIQCGTHTRHQTWDARGGLVKWGKRSVRKVRA